jgi:hypothetical protein
VPRDLADLDPGQRAVVDGWFPDGAEVVRDLSWGPGYATVLHLRAGPDGADVVLKAGGGSGHHVAREVAGYAAADTAWTARDLAPRLLHADVEHRLLVVDLLPGRLAADLPDDPDLHRQAGAALARLHRSGSRPDDGSERRQRDHSRALLDTEHRVDPADAAWLRAWLDAYDPGPTLLVPTHGDYSPRNWLVDDDPDDEHGSARLRVIDLGRFDHRPAASDLCRLHERHWRTRPDLAAAFVDGYGDDPRSGDLWTAQRIREAVGVVTWALRMGDTAFEQEGLATVAEIVAGR